MIFSLRSIFGLAPPESPARPPLPAPKVRVTSAHMAKHLRDISSRRQPNTRIPVHIKARSAWVARTKRKSLWSASEQELMRA